MNTENVRPKFRLILFLSILAVLLLATAWGRAPQADVKYQDRGDHYEGMKGTPVADRVELMSAMVDYKEDAATTPATFRLKFYLKDRAPVFITVREIDGRTNYWLDRVRPRGSWRAGFENEFAWPTAEVIKPLGVQLGGLGAVVQLDTDEPLMDVRVAPGILYHTRPPGIASAYLFTFKIGHRADVTCSFSKDEDNSPNISTQAFEMVGQRPRTVRWNASNARSPWWFWQTRHRNTLRRPQG
jgi:hypothetical protein